MQLRAPSRGDHSVLGPNGENLAPFLSALKRRDGKAFRSLVERVRAHYPRLESIDPKRTQYGWTHLEIQERWNGERATFNARQVSDGLLRLIAIAAMRSSKPPTSLLLLDEIENGMHPQLLGHFIGLLQELPPETQIIATSHSPIAMNFVKDPHGIVIVDRSKSGYPDCTPLTETKGYDRLRKAFDPGELWYNIGEEKLLR